MAFLIPKVGVSVRASGMLKKRPRVMIIQADQRQGLEADNLTNEEGLLRDWGLSSSAHTAVTNVEVYETRFR